MIERDSKRIIIFRKGFAGILEELFPEKVAFLGHQSGSISSDIKDLSRLPIQTEFLVRSTHPLSSVESLYKRDIFESFVDSNLSFCIKAHVDTSDPQYRKIEFERGLSAFLEDVMKMKFNYRYPEQIVHVAVTDRGIYLGRGTIDKIETQKKVFKYRNSIKNDIAKAMVQFCSKEEGKFLDPFCGGGTLVMEASTVLPELSYIIGDKDLSHLEGAERNILEVCPDLSLEKHHGRMDELSENIEDCSIDYIVTDPPFGMKIGRKIKFNRFYGLLLSMARRLLVSNGLLVIRVLKKDAFMSALDRIGRLKLEKEFEVNQGKFNSYLLIVRKDGEE